MLINCSSGGVFYTDIQYLSYVYPVGVYAFYSERIYYPTAAYLIYIECADTEENINILDHRRWI